MRSFFVICTTFTLIISQVAAFAVSAPNTATAGQPFEVTWTRNNPLEFLSTTFALRARNGNVIGDTVTVNTDHQAKNGKETFTIPQSGDFVIEAFAPSIPQSIAGSKTINVNAAAAQSLPPTTPAPAPAPTTFPADPSPTTANVGNTDTPADTAVNNAPPVSSTVAASTTEGDDSATNGNSDPGSTNSPPSATQSPGDSGSGTGSSNSVQSGTSGDGASTAKGKPEKSSTSGHNPNASSQTSLPDDPDAPSGVAGPTPGSPNATSTSSPITSNSNASPSGASSKSKTPVIVGAVLGALAFIILSFIGFVMWRRRNRRARTLMLERSFQGSMMVRGGGMSGLTGAIGEKGEETAPLSPDLEKEGGFEAAQSQYDAGNEYGYGYGSGNDNDAYGGMQSSLQPTQLNAQSYSHDQPSAYAPTNPYAQPYPTIITTPASPPATVLYSPPSGVNTSRPPSPYNPPPPRTPLPAPRTDRQMEVHEKVVRLKTVLIRMQMSRSGSSDGGHGEEEEEMEEEARELKRRIDRLEEMMESEWALGRVDVPPVGWEES